MRSEESGQTTTVKTEETTGALIQLQLNRAGGEDVRKVWKESQEESFWYRVYRNSTLFTKCVLSWGTTTNPPQPAASPGPLQALSDESRPQAGLQGGTLAPLSGVTSRASIFWSS
ncbi:hypothetical protein ATANTOWER_004665 [Ataeniobius toweri]|uniref:Uncharacterized protein n=1 Tax=Ataeniobius toweri TaxID=208326 RepID=A0ABU7BMN3_9TELE|nr:hypothetical protein [Ataeniobius toweri]